MRELIMIITGAIGTIGYSLIFNVKARHIPFATLGSIISCSVYLICMRLFDDLFLSNFIGALAATAYSECCAIVLRAPVSVFLLPSNIPLVPGGSLYYAMQSLITSDREGFREYGANTAYVALGIAFGIIIGTVIFYTFKKMLKDIKAKRSHGVK